VQLLARLHYEGYLVERLGTRAATATLARARSQLSVLATTRRVELFARRRRTRWPRGSTECSRDRNRERLGMVRSG
jgi:hypothetical protein